MEALNDLYRNKLCFYYKSTYDKDHDWFMMPKGKANKVMWAYYEGSNFDSSRHEDDRSDAEPEVEVEAPKTKEEPELNLQEAHLSSI